MEEGKNSLAAKIEKEIYKYTIRRLSANEEFKDVYRYRSLLPLHSDLRYEVSRKLLEIQEEINLCNNQIKAYQEGNNKAKLIPDRLL